MSTLLQCEDIRDRIYALIPVINWNGLKPIQPDYDRDVYDIALDVLRLITLGEDTWRNPVLEIICELQPSIKTSQKLVQAILARRQDNRIQPVVKSPHEEPTPDSRFSWACKGFKLLVDNGVWKMDIPEHNHQRGRKLRCLNDKTPYDADRRKTIISLQKPYYVVTSDNKQLQALLPWSAQPGDWVVGDPMDAGLTFGLILLRERGDGRYSIVGEVRADQRIFDCLDKVGQEFTVFFDLEDLIVLYVGEGQFDWKESDFTSDIDLQLIVNSLENAVCSAEGSSYAEMK
jgi:hypothetical protein